MVSSFARTIILVSSGSPRDVQMSVHAFVAGARLRRPFGRILECDTAREKKRKALGNRIVLSKWRRGLKSS